MFLEKGEKIDNANLEITVLLSIIFVLFLLFIMALLLLIYKLLYNSLEDQYVKANHEKKQKNFAALLPSDSGIRPISAILPRAMNSKLDAIYDVKRGTCPAIRNVDSRKFEKNTNSHFR